MIISGRISLHAVYGTEPFLLGTGVPASAFGWACAAEIPIDDAGLKGDHLRIKIVEVIEWELGWEMMES